MTAAWHCLIVAPCEEAYIGRATRSSKIVASTVEPARSLSRKNEGDLKSLDAFHQFNDALSVDYEFSQNDPYARPGR